MYSSEYTSGFSEPAASHLAAPPSPCHEDNVGQAARVQVKLVAIARRTLERGLDLVMRASIAIYAVKIWTVRFWLHVEISPYFIATTLIC
jgi:hypothetical protein